MSRQIMKCHRNEAYHRSEANDSCKVLVTKWKTKTIAVLFRNGKIEQVLGKLNTNLTINSVVVGKILRVLPQTNSAFLEIGEGQKGFLGLSPNDLIGNDRLIQGKNIPVQIKKEPIKTKPFEVTRKIELSGNYIVVKSGNGEIKISKKINKRTADIIEDWYRRNLQQYASDNGILDDELPVDLVIRTANSMVFRQENEAVKEAHLKNIKQELFDLISQTISINQTGQCFESGKMLYSPLPFYMPLTSDNKTAYESVEVVTDLPEIFHELSELDDNGRLSPNVHYRMYVDQELSLSRLYSLETGLNELLSEKVYLKCGGYLIIQQTEALVSVDVNSGKYDKKTDMDRHHALVNKEAAEELFVQMKARNLSGIIIVDFLKIKSSEMMQELENRIRELVKSDIVETRYFGFTRLGLCELTREKKNQSLSQMLGMDN